MSDIRGIPELDVNPKCSDSVDRNFPKKKFKKKYFT